MNLLRHSLVIQYLILPLGIRVYFFYLFIFYFYFYFLQVLLSARLRFAHKNDLDTIQTKVERRLMISIL